MSDLELKAANASSLLAPAELHGMVCGLGATRVGGFPLDEFVDLAGPDALTDEGSVKQFVNAVLEDLTNEELAFAPTILSIAQCLIHLEVITPTCKFDAVVPEAGRHLGHFFDREVGPLAGEKGNGPSHSVSEK